MNTDVVIYLHGFNSGSKSNTVALLKAAYEGQAEIVATDYDSYRPEQAAAYLSDVISSYLGKNLVLVGTSLGGFWAVHFATQLNLRCVAVNPCTQPTEALQQFVGLNQNFSDGQQYLLSEEMVQAYSNFPFFGASRGDLSIITQSEDEVIDSQEVMAAFEGKARVLVTPGGHRVTDISVLKSEIDLMLSKRG